MRRKSLKKRKSFKRKSLKKRRSFRKRRGGGNTFTGNSQPINQSSATQNASADDEFDEFGAEIPPTFDIPPLAVNELKQRYTAPIYTVPGVRDVLGSYAVKNGDTDLARLNLAGKNLIGNDEYISKIYSNIEKIPLNFLREKSIKMYERLDVFEKRDAYFLDKFKLLAERKVLPFECSSNYDSCWIFNIFYNHGWCKDRDSLGSPGIGIVKFVDSIEKNKGRAYLNTVTDNKGGLNDLWTENDTRKYWEAIYIVLKEFQDR